MSIDGSVIYTLHLVKFNLPHKKKLELINFNFITADDITGKNYIYEYFVIIYDY